MRRINPSLVELNELQDSQLYDVYARRGLHGVHHGVLFRDGEAKNMPGVVVKNLRGRVNCSVFPPGTPVIWAGGAPVEEFESSANPHVVPSTDLKSMSARELKALAAERGIQGYGGMRKAELLDALS